MDVVGGLQFAGGQNQSTTGPASSSFLASGARTGLERVHCSCPVEPPEAPERHRGGRFGRRGSLLVSCWGCLLPKWSVSSFGASKVYVCHDSSRHWTLLLPHLLVERRPLPRRFPQRQGARGPAASCPEKSEEVCSRVWHRCLQQ